MRKRTTILIISVVSATVILLISAIALSRHITRPHVKALLPGYDKNVYVIEQNGSLVFEMRGGDGMVSVSPKMFAKIVYETQTERPWWMNALNITKPSGALWVLIGLLGQLLFSGRMLVQWIVSEKQRKSVIPVAFWWLALGGASMLLVYFIWRRDIIGILGQGTGWLIYIRNLYFIFREHRESKSADAAD